MTIHTLYDASINQLPVGDLDARMGTPRNVDKEPDDNCLFEGGTRRYSPKAVNMYR